MIKKEELIRGCMAKASDDEMTFVLLGRDKAAPATIRAWVEERIKLGLNRRKDAKIIEALECADKIEADHRIASNALGSTDRGENGLYGGIGT